MEFNTEAKGSIKKIDSLGRITIPSMWRKIGDIKTGDIFNVFMTDEDTIVLKKIKIDYLS
jgi:AbrB family looped-hinge helix DNA binding protein